MITKANKLRSTRRETVDVASLEVVKTGFLGGVPGLPVVMIPQGTEPVDLVEWARHNRPLLDEQRLRHGGILFRGFDLGSVSGFERFAGAVCDELYADYGDLPSEEGGEKVYRSTPYPADKMILFHNESSHLDRWPSKQLFFCVTAAQSGGETPIVDCREVYRRLDPEVAERFERRKLMYVRNFTDGLDVSWRQFFRTEYPAVVERKCREAEMEIEWKEDGLRTRKVCDAVIVHPRTGEKAFFNQVQLHHLSCLDPEMRTAMLAVFDGRDLPRDVRYGDGEPIEDAVMEHVSAVYRELAVSFPWQAGDVLMLDNMLVAHARNPFVGLRKIVVAMGEMTGRADLR